jgi:hypothetical protein
VAVEVRAVTLYETVPVPVPLLPPVTVIHAVLLLTAVHAHPLVVVTAADCEPPAATTLWDVGASVKAHAPACVTVTVCDAIVSVPVRGLVEVLTAIAYATVPLPFPLPPPVTEIHDALLAPVHAQPLVVVTAVDNAPPAAGAVCAVDDSEKPQTPLCVTVSVRPAIVRVPERGLVAVLAETLYETVPLPVPLLPPVTEIHDVLLLTPVHPHPLVVVTAAEWEPPAATTL